MHNKANIRILGFSLWNFLNIIVSIILYLKRISLNVRIGIKIKSEKQNIFYLHEIF